MKHAVLIISLLISSLTGFAQTKKAGIAFLSTLNPEVTFYGMYPPRPSEGPRVFFKNGTTFTDSALFQSIKLKIAAMLPQLGFRLMPEDSIITSSNYKELAKKNYSGKTANDILAKGYAYPANFALLFTGTNDPDIMIEANGYFEMDNANKADGKLVSTLIYKMTIVAYNNKKKKVFSFKTKYKHPEPVKTAGSNASPWGYDIIEDLSAKEFDCLNESFKQIDSDMPEQLEKVNKFYSRQ